MQGPRKHDQYSLHLVSWKIWDIRQKPVWLQETSQHHRPADGLERYLCDTFAQRQQAVGLFFDLEKACETTWQYGIIPDLYRIGLRGRPIFVSEYLRDRRIRVRIGTTLSDEFYLEEGVPTGGVLAVTCLGLKNNELPSYIARDVFRALFVDDLAVCFRGRSLDTIERHLQQAVNAIQEWATRNGFSVVAHKCKVVHFTAPQSRAQRPPTVRIGNTLLSVEELAKFLGLWWDSHLHKFDRTTGDLYAPRPNGRGDMTRPPAPPIGLKVEEAMTSAETNAELVCPLRTTNFPPGTHGYDPKRHDLIEGVNKCKISRQEAQAKFNEYCEAQGSHDEVYTDGSKMNERVGAATIINRYFQNGETTCRQLSKRLTDNSTIFAAEATAISLALNHYRLIVPVHHNVVVYSDSISCLQAIEDEDTENPFICHIMNLLWVLSDRGTCVCFCWIPSHCGIEGNERMDQLAKETLDQDIDPLASVHYTDLKPLVNSYIQQLVQTKWDVAVHGQDLYFVKPTLGQPKKIQHLTRAEEVVITRLLSPIFCPEDHRLLVTTVVKHWALTICSWGVQCYRNVVTNTTQLTHWMPSLRQFPRLA